MHMCRPVVSLVIVQTEVLMTGMLRILNTTSIEPAIAAADGTSQAPARVGFEVKEDDSNYTFVATVPGYAKEDIKVVPVFYRT